MRRLITFILVFLIIVTTVYSQNLPNLSESLRNKTDNLSNLTQEKIRGVVDKGIRVSPIIGTILGIRDKTVGLSKLSMLVILWIILFIFLEIGFRSLNIIGGSSYIIAFVFCIIISTVGTINKAADIYTEIFSLFKFPISGIPSAIQSIILLVALYFVFRLEYKARREEKVEKLRKAGRILGEEAIKNEEKIRIREIEEGERFN